MLFQEQEVTWCKRSSIFSGLPLLLGWKCPYTLTQSKDKISVFVKIGPEEEEEEKEANKRIKQELGEETRTGRSSIFTKPEKESLSQA